MQHGGILLLNVGHFTFFSAGIRSERDSRDGKEHFTSPGLRDNFTD